MVNKLLNIKTIKAFEEALNVPIGTLQNLKQKTLYNKRFNVKKMAIGVKLILRQTN